MAGAIDYSECPGRLFGSRICRCRPVCRVCGWRKHMAIHGPVNNGGPGSKPYGHEFKPVVKDEDSKTEDD